MLLVLQRSMPSTALVSRSGYAPKGNISITAFWNAARVMVPTGGWSYDTQAIRMFGLSEYGDTNIQAKLGYGIGGSSAKDLWPTASSLLTGATKSLGDNFGKIDISVVNGDLIGDDCSRVNLMGIEDAYNWQWEMSQNVYFGSSANAGQTGNEIFIYEGNRMPTAAELADKPSGSYRQLVRPLQVDMFRILYLVSTLIYFLHSWVVDLTSYWADNFYGNSTGQLCLWGGMQSRCVFRLVS